MSEVAEVVITIAVALFAVFGTGEPAQDTRCGDAVASEEVCEQVLAEANLVGTVPAGHEQRERARGE